jgi:hypothetical protein
MQNDIRETGELLDKYQATIASQEAMDLFLEARALYENEFLAFVQEVYLLALDGHE